MHARNAGLQRLRSLTKRVGIATAVLTGVFTGLAAAGNSGKHHRRVVRRAAVPQRPAPAADRTTRVPPAPALPPLRDEEEAGRAARRPRRANRPRRSRRSAPPVQVHEPPVVVSGGS